MFWVVTMIVGTLYAAALAWILILVNGGAREDRQRERALEDYLQTRATLSSEQHLKAA